MKISLNNKSLKIQLFLILAGILLFLPGLGRVHLFDWDEINFAESAREMLVSGDYLNVQINFETFWEKPPLFIWMQAASMKIFGVNEFAARFPNVICGIVVLLVLFNIGKELKNSRFGILWAAMYVTSIIPFFYFKSGIIDPWFNLFIFLGIYFAIRITSPSKKGNPHWQAFWAAFFIGLAVLTKGPVGFLIFLLSFGVYFLIKRFKTDVKLSQLGIFTVVFMFIGGFWFILQLLNGNYTILKDFIEYQIRLFKTEDAGHGGFLLYHFVILLMGVFPASILALPSFKRAIFKSEKDEKVKDFLLWMMIVFWVVLILFTIVRTKIVHYSSMCYFPLTFLAAWYADKVLNNEFKIYKWMRILLIFIAALFGIAAFAITFFDKFKSLIIPYSDEFTQGNLQATANWMGFEWIFGVVLIVGTILFVYFYKKEEIKKAFIYLLSGSLIFVYGAMFFITPQVEKYSQLSAIEFYKSKQDEDCYIYPISKTYAHYFYSNRMPENKNADKLYLECGELEKPCYFVIKNTKSRIEEFVKETPDAVKLYDKNGFAFFVRQSKK